MATSSQRLLPSLPWVCFCAAGRPAVLAAPLPSTPQLTRSGVQATVGGRRDSARVVSDGAHPGLRLSRAVMQKRRGLHEQHDRLLRAEAFQGGVAMARTAHLLDTKVRLATKDTRPPALPRQDRRWAYYSRAARSAGLTAGRDAAYAGPRASGTPPVLPLACRSSVRSSP